MGHVLSKVLEFIGLVDEVESDAREGARPRYREEVYEEPRYTPRQQARPASDARGSRFDGAQTRSSGAQRSRTDGARTRGGAGYSGRAETGGSYEDNEYSVARPQRSNKMQPNPTTIVYYLHSLSECSGVIEDLIGGNSVLLNLEETDVQLMQRVVDTLAGAAFALHAKIRKVSEKMYLIAPENVDVNMTSSVNRHY